MSIQRIKILRRFFESVKSGLKTFEIRDNSDRNFQAGETLHFIEVEERNHILIDTGRVLWGRITYVTNYEQKPGYVVFAFTLLANPETT